MKGSNMLKYLSMIIIAMGAIPDMYAWWPAGHYSIARAAGYSHNEAGYFNLPDAWDSMTWYGSITDVFCWSHSVKRDGTTNLIPNIPVYDTTREPGSVIKALASGKVVNWTAANTQTSALNTAKYFRGHNAADNNVHWAFFQGGGGNLSNWTVQHQEKEKWSEYCILDYLLEITFSSQDTIETFWEITIDQNNTSQVIIPIDVNNINAWIIQLAQKVARKNRIALDEGSSPSRWTTVETVQTIQEKIVALQTAVNNSIREMTQTKYDELKTLAASNGWTVNALININEDNSSEFYESRNNMISWLNGY